MQHTLSLLVEDQPGIVARLSGMFARRSFNIISMTTGTTDLEGVNRITIVVETDEVSIEQITKQLNKLIPVLKVIRQKDDQMVSRALLMVKVAANNENRAQVVDAANLFRARVVDVARHLNRWSLRRRGSRGNWLLCWMSFGPLVSANKCIRGWLL